jgi:hypothetical protein
MLSGAHYITRGNNNMDHDTVVRENMTERYLLAELTPKVRDEFEEHFFDCQECAADVRAGAAFVANGKSIWQEKEYEVVVPVPRPAPASRPWFNWLRPVFAVPALALLLAVVGIQAVTLQQFARRAKQPHILPVTTLNLQTAGSNSEPLVIRQGEGFFLNVIVPPEHHYPVYRFELRAPSGATESPEPAKESADGTYQISFPEAIRQSGIYKLTVHGVNDSSQDVEPMTSSFELQVQK